MSVLVKHCQKEHKRTENCARSAGFSVLEAIIAVAILAVAFLPLLALQGQMTRTTIALERNEKLITAKRSALAYVSTLNLTRDPRGSLDLGQASMRWTAIPVSEERMVRGAGGDEGRFAITLYDVQVTLDFADQRPQEFTVRAIGWRATKSMLSGF